MEGRRESKQAEGEGDTLTCERSRGEGVFKKRLKTALH
jgi:hypothetical protein